MDARLRTPGEPDAPRRVGLIAAGLLATAAIGYLHVRGGLAYEFHVFFLLPVAAVAWLAGRWPGALIAIAAVLVWGITDWHLGGATGSRAALLFNSAMRLAVFLAAVGLLVKLRVVLARETVLARHDPLTALPNRRMFYADGGRMLAQARRRAEALTVMFIDIDDFKRVNDEFGHKAGDELLCAVAEVLRQQVRGSDLVGRLGGDEFAMLLPGMTESAADGFAQELLERLRARVAERGRPVGFSIGLACFRVPPQDMDTLVRHADALMYQVKRAGRDAIRRETYDGDAPAALAANDRRGEDAHAD